MRTFIACLLIIALGIFCFYSNRILYNTASKTENMIEDVESAVKKGNYTLAKKEYRKVKKYWDRKEKILVLFISHSTLDEITLSLGKIETTIREGEEDLFFYQKSELDVLLKRVKDINSFSYEHLV